MAPVELSVVTYLWRGTRGYQPAHVNALARGVRKHMVRPYRFVCVTDGFDAAAFDTGVLVVPTPPEALHLAAIPSPEGERFPSSYRRLYTYSKQAKNVLGERVLQLDVDCVPVRSLEWLLEQADGFDFMGWRPRSAWGTPGRLAGGTFVVNPGAHREIFIDFAMDPAGEIAKARAAGYRGSDQAYMSYRLPGAPSWPWPHGIYQSQDMRAPARMHWPLPADARLVHFNGPRKPWEVLTWPWVRENYGAGVQ